MFAATGCLAWNEAAYAARLSAAHAEEAVAVVGPVAREVDTLFFALNTCYTIGIGRFC